MKNSPNAFQVLCVEDNEPDQQLLSFLFARTKIDINLKFISDGPTTLSYLKDLSEESGANGPDLICLDLNVPKIDGRAIMQSIRSMPSYRCTPIVVLSTSASDREIEDCYAIGANAFLSKVTDIKRFQVLIDTLCRFYFDCVTLPTRPGKKRVPVKLD